VSTPIGTGTTVGGWFRRRHLGRVARGKRRNRHSIPIRVEL
jgi:hypothetical protein